jgi:hypothetical protein
MPKFVKFSIFLTVVFWLLWLYLLFFGISPGTYREIFLFLGVLFISLGFTLSFPFYFIYRKRYPKFTDVRVLFKRALKWGYYISFGFIGVALMDAFHIVKVLNIGLFGLLCVGIFFQLKGKK